MVQYAFNTAGIPPRENNFELIPKGWYLAHVIESDIVPTSSGSGKMAKFKFEILDPKYRNRQLTARINVRNQSQKAEQIGQQELRDLCQAAGLPHGFTDTVQTHNRPMLIHVKIKAPEGKYDADNEINGFKAANPGSSSSASDASSSGGQTQQPPAAATTQRSDPSANIGSTKRAPWL